MTTATTTVTERRRLTAIRAAWLFDGTNPNLLPDPTVVLDGSTILSVGSAVPVPEGATVVTSPARPSCQGLLTDTFTSSSTLPATPCQLSPAGTTPPPSPRWRTSPAPPHKAA
jgi:hypothetical protein